MALNTLFAILITGFSAWATVPDDCLVRFASVSDGNAIDYGLIDSTYDQLFDALGKAVPPSVLQKMLAGGGSPLHVPEETDANVQSLNRNLKSFEDLLEKRNWKQPEVLARLGTRLRSRIAALEKGKERQRQAVERTLPDVTIPMGKTNPDYHLSPDGKWLVLHDGSLATNETDPWTVTIVNTRTREVKKYPTLGGVRRLFFSGDGKRLLFTYLPYRLDWIPFENGVPDFKRVQTTRLPEFGKSHFSTVKTSADPNIVFVEAGQKELGRIDLSTKQAKPLDLSAVLTTGDGMLTNGWQVVPGTQNLALHVVNSGDRSDRYEIVGVNPDHTVTRLKTYGPWKPGQGDNFLPLRWRSDGEMEYYLDGARLMINDGAGRRALYHADRTLLGQQAHLHRDRVEIDPAGRTALFYVKGMNDAAEWVIWDLEHQREIRRLPRDIGYPILDRDGREAYSLIVQDDGRQSLRVFNVQGRRDGSPP